MAIIGIDNLLKDLDKITKLKSLQKGLEKACVLVQAESMANCPVDDGVLKKSITYEVEEDEGVVGTNVEYAPYVEFGTGLFAKLGMGRQTPWSYCDSKGVWHTTAGQHPQPFLLPAYEKNKKKIVKIIQEEIREELRGLSK